MTNPSTTRGISQIRVLALLPMLALVAHAQTQTSNPPEAAPIALDTLEVTEKQADASVVIDAAKANLQKVAGGASLVDNSLVSRGRVGTSADVLAFTPGVFAAPPAGGGDGIKISARGSGIARTAGNFFRSGVLFTFDGLPVTGPSGTPYELFETYGLNYTEVLLGGNAFDYGALQLGGAVNYVTKTGFDASPFEARLELGSFATRKYQVSSGQVLGDSDYFISATYADSDGFQEWSGGDNKGFAGNFGHRFSATLSTRFYLRYRTTYNRNPGNLTLAQLRDNPKQSPAGLATRSDREQPGSSFVGNVTTFDLTPDSKLELGALHHNAPIIIQPGPSTSARSDWEFRTVTGQAKYTLNHDLLDLPSVTTAALSVSHEYYSDVKVFANNPAGTGVNTFGTLQKKAEYSGSNDSSLRVGNALDLTDRLTLNTGLSLVYIRRASTVTFRNPLVAPAAPAPGAVGPDFERDDYYLAPRVGVLFDVTQDTTLFANVTRSIEAANSWQFNRGSNANYFNNDPIRDQKALAFEVGGRTSHGAFTGSLSVYHTQVTDELLTVPINPALPAAGSFTFNGPDTYKQGVELGLQTTLWSENGFLAAAPQPATGRATAVTFTQTYTYNDFGFKDDGFFPGADELPGVPRQNYQARLSFDHASGFYVNLSLFYASSYYVDFVNSLEAPSYVLYNVGFGYAAPSGRWEAFVDLRNVSDKKYASSAGPVFNAAGSPNTAAFQAGDGRAVYGGLTVRF